MGEYDEAVTGEPHKVDTDTEDIQPVFLPEKGEMDVTVFFQRLSGVPSWLLLELGKCQPVHM